MFIAWIDELHVALIYCRKYATCTSFKYSQCEIWQQKILADFQNCDYNLIFFFLSFLWLPKQALICNTSRKTNGQVYSTGGRSFDAILGDIGQCNVSLHVHTAEIQTAFYVSNISHILFNCPHRNHRISVYHKLCCFGKYEIFKIRSRPIDW